MMAESVKNKNNNNNSIEGTHMSVFSSLVLYKLQIFTSGQRSNTRIFFFFFHIDGCFSMYFFVFVSTESDVGCGPLVN